MLLHSPLTDTGETGDRSRDIPHWPLAKCHHGLAENDNINVTPGSEIKPRHLHSCSCQSVVQNTDLDTSSQALGQMSWESLRLFAASLNSDARRQRGKIGQPQISQYYY